ncbi:IS3 family transposase [Bacillus halotolerans]|uniref:IS3 family transposase n=1 Tax=Bacillus halotolerans TaxID=260554 RepID=UPI00298EDA93|nr:IS3 family transposase [Bacillus halotolerans]WPC78834.1 IS3 family transposase [Bacillus halotolerans]WPC79153.1 IS3 family transposase [Bacillus halotolerans]WPC79899.1 IS3 family transposase [Bacillus halotolerans]WPC80491.1 IS3 family transposase [Bacillus halotolerans]WPC81919.1 IS3 family transposase [Bacillus halotolerans]
MGTRMSYPIEVKQKAVEMRLAGVPMKEIMQELNIRNKTQVQTWVRWHKAGDTHRFEQPVGKQYTYGKGPEYSSELEKLQAENRYLRQQNEVFKKVQRIGKEVDSQTSVELVEGLHGTMTVQNICVHLGISRASYYRWKKNLMKDHPKRHLEKQIGTLCREHKYRYGYRKITAILKKEMRINHKTVQRIMQKNQWQCRVKVKKRKKNGQPYAVVDNILDRNFQSDHPLEKLVTDITYLPYGQKQLYLSSILDVYNGEVIAFTIGDKQDTDFVLNTLDQLPTLPQNCVLHSDQGSVYTSYEYQKAVKTKGITMSMSRKGTPADNASIESFHSSLKSETFYLNSINRTTTAIVERTVKEYIYYYNNIRIQTKLNSQSPISYRQLAV